MADPRRGPARHRRSDRSSHLGATGRTCACAGTRSGKSRNQRDALIHIRCGKRVIRPAVMARDRYVFPLPAGARDIRLMSRASAPGALRPWLDDRRILGVAVGGIVLHDGHNPPDFRSTPGPCGRLARLLRKGRRGSPVDDRRRADRVAGRQGDDHRVHARQPGGLPGGGAEGGLTSRSIWRESGVSGLRGGDGPRYRGNEADTATYERITVDRLTPVIGAFGNAADFGADIRPRPTARAFDVENFFGELFASHVVLPGDTGAEMHGWRRDGHGSKTRKFTLWRGVNDRKRGRRATARGQKVTKTSSPQTRPCGELVTFSGLGIGFSCRKGWRGEWAGLSFCSRVRSR